MVAAEQTHHSQFPEHVVDLVKSLALEYKVVRRVLGGESLMHAAVYAATDQHGFVTLEAPHAGHIGPVTLLIDPVAVRKVLHNESKLFADKPIIEQLHRIVGEGIVTTNGESWYHLRHFLTKFFGGLTHHAVISDSMIAATNEMFSRWQSQIEAEKVVNFTDEFRWLTSDVFLRSFFGLESNEKTREMQKHIQAIFRGIVHTFAHPLEALIGKIGHHHSYDADVARLRELTQEMIDDRRVEMKKVDFRGDDILSGLIREFGAPEQADMLMHNVLTLFAAGYETTSTAFNFAAKELTQHPDVWEKIVNEVDEKLGSTPPASLMDLEKLPYLHAVVTEVLRLHPPLPFMMREASDDGELILGNGQKHQVKKGEIFVISADVLHNDPANYKNPGQFLPGRHIKDDPDYDGPKSNDMITEVMFGGGIRSCLGQIFARYELAMTLAMMAQRYNFKVRDPESLHRRFTLTSAPNRPVEADVSFRSAPNDLVAA